ncbi:cytochrome P450 [Sphingopyxis panaciterrae]|uniref:cytochrome P450 n=1 Tax=Sphingopyxis panaciterrae TaxID=363841 RepID=UPI00141DAC4F|nr:cytochrome P450 [Sphingopyxis panaciterrae]NIJ35949.1 cytochrome P450 [Sphingopyxis panaciterrae]
MDARTTGNQLVDPAFHADPAAYHALLRRLRAEAPVFWVEPDDYAPFWIVTKHADIMRVEKSMDLFVNGPRVMLRKTVIDDQIRKVTGGRPFLLNQLPNMDGSEHRFHRKLTQAWFAPARIKVLEDELRGYARDLFDRALQDGGRCDFMRSVASWYPLRVIMRIIGVPAADEPLMLKMTQQLFGPEDPEIKTEQMDVIATVNGFFDYFRDLLAERRARPSDDLATLLAGAEIGEKEALSYFILAATAGHDTTSASIAGGLLALLQNPGEMQRLRRDMTRLPSAVDEMVRWVSPVTHFFRTPIEDYTLRGQNIAAGQAMMMCYPAANRDEEVFEDPYRFDIGRPPNRHLAFGYGPHLCLGQHLAKMEMRIFFEELFARIDSIELDGDPRWIQTNFVGGLKSLPVRLTLREAVPA